MDQELEQLTTSLRRTIDQAASSVAIDDDFARALRRALALLWSAHDELESLQLLMRRHA